MRALAEHRLEAALDARSGDLAALVGAGGKTTLLYRLTGELFSRGLRAAAATTTKILPPVESDGAGLYFMDETLMLPPDLSRPLVLGSRLREDGKVQGIPPEWCRIIMKRNRLDFLAVEADGSRMLPLKAPGDHEPVVPAGTTLFVAVAGLSCLGRPLDARTVFRHDAAGPLMGLKEGEIITPDALARLFLAAGGAMKGCPAGARMAAFLNQADDSSLVKAGREIAEALLVTGSPWDRVVITELRKRDPLEDIWVR